MHADVVSLLLPLALALAEPGGRVPARHASGASNATRAKAGLLPRKAAPSGAAARAARRRIPGFRPSYLGEPAALPDARAEQEASAADDAAARAGAAPAAVLPIAVVAEDPRPARSVPGADPAEPAAEAPAPAAGSPVFVAEPAPSPGEGVTGDAAVPAPEPLVAAYAAPAPLAEGHAAPAGAPLASRISEPLGEGLPVAGAGGAAPSARESAVEVALAAGFAPPSEVALAYAGAREVPEAGEPVAIEALLPAPLAASSGAAGDPDAETPEPGALRVEVRIVAH